MATAQLQLSLPPQVGGVEAGRLPFCSSCGHQKRLASRTGGCPSAATVAIGSCRRRGSPAASLQAFLPSEGACVEVGGCPSAGIVAIRSCRPWWFAGCPSPGTEAIPSRRRRGLAAALLLILAIRSGRRRGFAAARLQMLLPSRLPVSRFWGWPPADIGVMIRRRR